METNTGCRVIRQKVKKKMGRKYKEYKEYYFTSNNTMGAVCGARESARKEVWEVAKRQAVHLLQNYGRGGFIQIEGILPSGKKELVFFAQVGSPAFARHFGVGKTCRSKTKF